MDNRASEIFRTHWIIFSINTEMKMKMLMFIFIYLRPWSVLAERDNYYLSNSWYFLTYLKLFYIVAYYMKLKQDLIFTIHNSFEKYLKLWVRSWILLLIWAAVPYYLKLPSKTSKLKISQPSSIGYLIIVNKNKNGQSGYNRTKSHLRENRRCKDKLKAKQSVI